MKFNLEVELDSAALKESGLPPDAYIQREMGWLQDSGIHLRFISEAQEQREPIVNNYEAMLERHKDERDAFPLQYAFNQMQFLEGMWELGVNTNEPNWQEKVFRLGETGGFFLRENAPELTDMLQRHHDELETAVNIDVSGRGFSSDMFETENTRAMFGYTEALTTVDEVLKLEEYPALAENKELLRHTFIEEGEAYSAQHFEPGAASPKHYALDDWNDFWKGSQDTRIEDFIKIGDKLSEEFVHHLARGMGHGGKDLFKENYLQLGSPFDYQMDDKGELQPRFFTIAREDKGDSWRYIGHCHRGEELMPEQNLRYERASLQPYEDEYGCVEQIAISIHPDGYPGNLQIEMQRLVQETGLMEPYSDVTSFAKPLPYLQAAIDAAEVEPKLIGWLDQNGYGEVVGSCTDEYGFNYVVYQFNEEKLRETDPRCFAAYAQTAEARPFYLTFGSAAHSPFQGGWVEMHANDREQAIGLFRSHFPDHVPGTVNCAFVYDETAWRQAQMEDNFGEKCHLVITKPGPFAVAQEHDKETQAFDKLLGDVKDSAAEKNAQRDTMKPPGKQEPDIGR